MVYYKVVTAFYNQYCCNQTDIVFDSYRKMFIKVGEREKRGSTAALEVKIYSPAALLLKQWANYTHNKRNLCNSLAEFWCEQGVTALDENSKVVIGSGFSKNLKTVRATKDTCEAIPDLFSDREEADIRLLLHAKHFSKLLSRIIIQSPGTDVAVLCTSKFDYFHCEGLWFKTSGELRFIPVHLVCQKLGSLVCAAFLAFQALTGCETVSSFSGKCKKKALDVMYHSIDHQKALESLGKDEWREQIWLFCQKQQKNEGLPPTYDSLAQNLKRANYQTLVWN